MTLLKKGITFLALFLSVGELLFFTSACGYSNPHSRIADLDKNGDGKIRIFLNMWNNQTNLLGFQGQIQQSLIHVLTKSNRFYLTQNRVSADYILDGTIYSVQIPGLSYGAFDRAIEVRGEIKLEYRLVDASDGKVFLQKRQCIKHENFLIGADAVSTQSNQDLAQEALATTLANNIDIQLFYIFTRKNMSNDKEPVPTDEIEKLD